MPRVGLVGLLVALACGCSVRGDAAGSVAAKAAGSVAAKKGGSLERAPEGIELRMDRARAVDGGALELTLVRIQDSRCAKGLRCVWEGEVTATFRVVEVARDKDRSDLALTVPGVRPGRATDRSVARVGRIAIRLLSVEPYPRSDTATERSQYTARLAVSAKDPAIQR
jgi:hypothetical protein